MDWTGILEDIASGITANSSASPSQPDRTEGVSRPGGLGRPAVGGLEQKARLQKTQNLEVVRAPGPPKTEVMPSVRLDVNGTRNVSEQAS